MEKGPSTFAEYWTSEFNENYHYNEHGEEMGFENITEYSKAAKDFIKNTDTKNILRFRDPSGAIYKYNKKTGEFAIISRNGKIVTYYILEGGTKSFWNLLLRDDGILL